MHKPLRLCARSFKTKIVNQLLRLSGLSLSGIYISRGSSFYSRVTTLGYGSRINGRIVVKGSGSVDVGKYCAIGDGVRIISSNHDMRYISVQLRLQKEIVGHGHVDKSKRDVKLGSDVWVGDCAIILPGVSIGDGAVIGAGAIVTKDVDAYSIVAGNPARKIGQRFDDPVIAELKKINWWDMPKSKLKRHKEIFSSRVTVDKLHSSGLMDSSKSDADDKAELL